MSSHKPRKRFGQNFLHDAHIIQNIIQTLNPQPTDHLVEIGPGLGALTLPTLEKSQKLTVVEIDRDLIDRWQSSQYAANGQLAIIAQDALTVDYGIIHPGNPIRVFGNLPYNISTPLLLHLFSQLTNIQDMLFMLQKEVVDRLVAPPNCKDYGRLSVTTQTLCEAENVLHVPPGAFNPPPKVQSAVVQLKPLPTPKCPLEHVPLLQSVVADAFGQRRKVITNSLKKYSAEVIPWNQFDISPKARAENISVEQFIELTLWITKHGSAK